MSDSAPAPDPNADDAGEQSFLSHLVELRARLVKAVAAWAVAMVFAVPYARDLYALLAKPLVAQLPEGGRLIAIDVAGPFVVPLKLAAFAALAVSIPVILYQAWAFVAPGLYRHERRLAVPLLLSSVLLFYAGVAFAYFLVLPTAFHVLAAMTPDGVAMMTDIAHYLDFVLTTFFAFGVCFEVPVAIVIIAALGWFTPAQMAAARRYVILGATVASAILAPPDATSMLLLAIPLCILFEVGLVAARLVTPRERAASA